MDSEQSANTASILIEGELTQQILSAAFTVQNTLGAGFLEKVYENALAIELRKRGLAVETQKAFPVRYEGAIVGDYQADMVVSGKVVVECKTVANLDAVHEAQLINYLKTSGIEVGLLVNFARPKLQYRRFVL